MTPTGFKMHAQLLSHGTHASGFGSEHSEDSLENYRTYPVGFFNQYLITLNVSVPPGIKNVILLSRTVLRENHFEARG